MNKNNFISLLNDVTFKYLWKEERSRKWLEKVIKYTTDIDLDGYTLIDNELNGGGDYKDYRLDILMMKDNHFVNIEMNRFTTGRLDSYIMNKNHSYLYRIAGNLYSSGERYEKKLVTQINFNNCYCPIRRDVGKLIFELCDKKYEVVIEGIKDYEIYLESYKGICYNDSDKKNYYLSMFTAKSFDEMNKIAGSDKEALYIVESLEKLNQDKYFGALYDANVIQKKTENSARYEGYKEGKVDGIKEGKEEGLKEGLEKGANNKTIEIALSLLKNDVDINIISSSTGLSLDEIENLEQS